MLGPLAPALSSTLQGWIAAALAPRRAAAPRARAAVAEAAAGAVQLLGAAADAQPELLVALCRGGLRAGEAVRVRAEVAEPEGGWGALRPSEVALPEPPTLTLTRTLTLTLTLILTPISLTISLTLTLTLTLTLNLTLTLTPTLTAGGRARRRGDGRGARAAAPGRRRRGRGLLVGVAARAARSLPAADRPHHGRRLAGCR